MSAHEVNAVLALGPEFPALVELVPAKRRPRWQNAMLVALALANRYRPGRGYVDETVAQIEAVVPIRDARDALQALDTLGVWSVSLRGRSGAGTRRVPGPRLLAMLGGADPAQDDDDLGGADPAQGAPDPQRGSDSTLGGVSADPQRGSDPPSAGYAPILGGVCPATPPSTTSSTTSPTTESLSQPDDGLDAARAHVVEREPMIGGKLARLMAELLNEREGVHPVHADARWALEAEALVTEHGADPTVVARVMAWLVRDGHDKDALFWRPKVHDLTYFRAKWPRLLSCWSNRRRTRGEALAEHRFDADGNLLDEPEDFDSVLAWITGERHDVIDVSATESSRLLDGPRSVVVIQHDDGSSTVTSGSTPERKALARRRTAIEFAMRETDDPAEQEHLAVEKADIEAALACQPIPPPPPPRPEPAPRPTTVQPVDRAAQLRADLATADAALAANPSPAVARAIANVRASTEAELAALAAADTDQTTDTARKEAI